MRVKIVRERRETGCPAARFRQPVTGAEITDAYRADALFDAGRDDPNRTIGSLTSDAETAGERMSGRTA
jgi:putative transposase